MNDFENPFLTSELAERADPASSPFTVAVVNAADASGLTLTVDGAAGTKKYRYNKGQTFAAGDRVLAARVRGTLVVLCKI